jgi:hypothetical protein
MLNGTAGRHLLDIAFQLPDILPRDFGVDNITFGRDFGVRGGGKRNVSVDWGLVDNLFTW